MWTSGTGALRETFPIVFQTGQRHFEHFFVLNAQIEKNETFLTFLCNVSEKVEFSKNYGNIGCYTIVPGGGPLNRRYPPQNVCAKVRTNVHFVQKLVSRLKVSAAHTHARTRTHPHTHTRARARTHARTRAHTRTHARTHARTRARVRARARMCVRVPVLVCRCVDVSDCVCDSAE